MFSFWGLSLKMPSQVGEVAGQFREPEAWGNLLIVAVFLVFILIYAFWLERHNIVINLIGLYVGLLGVNFFPSYKWSLGGWMESWWAQIVILGVIFLVTVFILSRTGFFRISYGSGFITRWWQAIVSGILQAGLLTSIILAIAPNHILRQFSSAVLDIFISETASFLWLILPLVGLILIKGKRRGPGRPAY